MMKKSPLVAETGASADCDERFAKGSRGYSKRRARVGAVGRGATGRGNLYRNSLDAGRMREFN
jgi:hypothetical protein